MPAQPNQSLIDGITVLQSLAVKSEPVGVRQLARDLSLEPTRVQRLLATLAHIGLTEQDDKRRYRVGPGVHVLAAQAMFASGLLHRAAEHLRGLHDLGHVVALGVLWRDRVCYLYHGDAHTSGMAAVGRVALYPAHQSSIGHALLATRPPRECKRLLKDAPAPAQEIQARTRQDGYAVVPQPGGRMHVSLAVALSRPAVAAISVAGPIPKRERPAVVARLQAAAHSIEASTPSPENT